jgi:hypothetical protein
MSLDSSLYPHNDCVRRYRTLRTAAVLAWILIGSNGCANGSSVDRLSYEELRQRANENYREADHALLEGAAAKAREQFSEAVRSLRMLLERHGAEVDRDNGRYVATFMLSRSLLHSGKIDESESLLKLLALHEPSDPDVHELQGEIHLNQARDCPVGERDDLVFKAANSFATAAALYRRASVEPGNIPEGFFRNSFRFAEALIQSKAGRAELRHFFGGSRARGDPAAWDEGAWGKKLRELEQKLASLD